VNAAVLLWDIETVFDHRGFAAANGDDGESDDEVRASKGRQVSEVQRERRGIAKKSAWLCAAPP
jgi:hypothetical protein